jgi:ssDNA-specific exonuclease RecJ
MPAGFYNDTKMPSVIYFANSRELSRFLKGFGVKGYSRWNARQKFDKMKEIIEKMDPVEVEKKTTLIVLQMREEAIKRGHTL